MLLIETRDDRPEPEPERIWLDLPELRPWRWFAAGVIAIGLSFAFDGWPSMIPLWLGMGLVARGFLGYYRGNDGMSSYHQ
jgi:hypothetical protein